MAGGWVGGSALALSHMALYLHLLLVLLLLLMVVVGHQLLLVLLLLELLLVMLLLLLELLLLLKLGCVAAGGRLSSRVLLPFLRVGRV